MIEREFVNQKKREFQVRQFISKSMSNVGHSYTELQRTPLGEKVIIHTSRPGLIVGRKGQNINKLTEALKTEFKLENPQVEISEVENPDLDANIMAERISSSLERFGSNRFKGIMHKTMADIMNAGALGVEIRLSGKLPSSRAKSWRVYTGHLKKCGDAAITSVRKATTYAKLKSGVVGIQVNILPSGIVMPDAITVIENQPKQEESAETTKKDSKTEDKEQKQEGKESTSKSAKTETKELKPDSKESKPSASAKKSEETTQEQEKNENK